MGETWQNTSKNFNRYIQKLRRMHNIQVQYIRAIEAHADSYPHIHIVLQFPNPISVDNARYFDPLLYRKWKGLWTFGLSDYQPPRSKRSPILYLIKYISKGATLKTIWKKMLPKEINAVSQVAPELQQSSTNSLPGHSDSSATSTTPDPDVKFVATNLLCKKYELKQLTWSRGFIFPSLPKARRPETGQQALFTQRYK